MKILGKDKLEKFSRKHPDSRKAITRWAADVERENWQTPQDIKAAYQSADFLAGNRVIFNIRGNNFRLAAVVVYTAGRLIVEWVGTHAEYDKKSF